MRWEKGWSWEIAVIELESVRDGKATVFVLQVKKPGMDVATKVAVRPEPPFSSHQAHFSPWVPGEQMEGGKEQREFGKLWKAHCGAATFCSQALPARRIPTS